MMRWKLRRLRPSTALVAKGSHFVILSAVLVLYGIYVLCTVALVWTAIAVTRHIVQHRRLSRSHSEHHDESV